VTHNDRSWMLAASYCPRFLAGAKSLVSGYRVNGRRSRSHVVRKGRKVWTVDQLQTFLQRARADRFFALWVLEATSGMRRCELAGARRDGLKLDAGTLTIEITRVVVDGQVIESDGKTENAQRTLALDPFTLAALKIHVEMLDQERAELGPDYEDHGLLFCWETGKPPHPDTITRLFHRLADKAGLPKINLHDVRHSYATAGRDAKIDWKALSTRIGHSDVAFTMRQYVQADLEADRKVANTLAALIIGGSLASVEIPDQPGGQDQDDGDRPGSGDECKSA
jgi:integrase